jgi:enoyl-CoA hydratase/carnithine racemase
MREHLGLSRTVELALTGRLMDAAECYQLGLIHHVVPKEQVLAKALEIADELSRKAPLAMRLNKAWLREMTEAGFRASIDAAIRAHRRSYDSGEPARKIDEFFAKRSGNPTG